MTDALRKLGWLAADYCYAAWWQVRARLGPQDERSFRAGWRTPIVILPGVYETWRFLMPVVRDLHQRGHPVHVVGSLKNNRVPVAVGAALVGDYLVRHGLEHVVLVAHSKGGLIGKHLMSFGVHASRIDAMVAVAAPFGGSRYAHYVPGVTLRAFSARNPTMRLLTEALEANPRIVSVFARFDPHIPEGSELAGAHNVCVNTGGHFRILAHPRTRAIIRSVAAGVGG